MLTWSSCAAVEQLPLFRRLPVPRGAVPWHRVRARRANDDVDLTAALQLAFAFRLRTLERDIDTEFDYPAHVVVRAGDAPLLQIDTPRSVFDLADIGRQFRLRERFGDAAGFENSPPVRIERTAGVIKHVGASYPVRATGEDIERERVRRAKQRPPKPSRKAKTRSRKLLDLIGVDDGDE